VGTIAVETIPGSLLYPIVPEAFRTDDDAPAPTTIVCTKMDSFQSRQQDKREGVIGLSLILLPVVVVLG
jgi:hypothetical protein